MKHKLLLITSILFVTFGNTVNTSCQWVETTVSGDMTALVESGSNLFAGTDGGGVLLSTDNGASWNAVNTGLGSTPQQLEVYTLAVNGTNLFAAISNGGVFLSTNNGTSWNAVNTGLPQNFTVASFGVSGTNLFAASEASNSGVYLSTNNGTSWNLANTGLPPNVTVFAFVATEMNAPSPNLFAGTYGGGVFLSTNNGASWAPVNNGLTNMDIFALAASGTNTLSPMLFAGTFASNGIYGGVYRSTNNGTSWTLESAGLLNSDVYALEMNGMNIFAGTDSGIFLSTDSGTSWTEANTGFPPSIYVTACAVIGSNLFAAVDSADMFGDVAGSVWWRPLSQMVSPSAVTAPIFVSGEIQIYPNPTSSILHVISNSSDITITDLLGRIWLHSIDSAHDLDVSMLPQGVYYISDATSRAQFVKE